MTDMTEEMDQLGPQEKRALLARLLKKKTEKADVVTSRCPLSYGQQALWFLHKGNPESAAYHVAFTARIRSYVDIPALQRAFQALVDRHGALRTTFPTQDGAPVQEIHTRQTVCFEQVNAATWSWDELKEQVGEAYTHPFNLETGPLMRVHVFTRSEQDHVLLITIHHIVIDIWSVWIILGELRELYAAEKTGRRLSLPSLAVSYADYVRKQIETIASPAGKRLEQYWRRQLSGELPVLNLPTDRPRPPVQTFNGDSCYCKLTAELTRRLTALAQSEGVTLYMLILTAFYVLLSRYTGQTDILVGSPVAGRTQAEFSKVAGYFVNMVVLRADLSGASTFTSCLQQVRRTVLGALKHQDYPFPLLVKKLQPKRDPSRSPLFQAGFVFQQPHQSQDISTLFTLDSPRTWVDWGELQLEPYEMAQQEGQFDLLIEMIASQHALNGIFHYNTDLFDHATIVRMTGHFKVLLEGIAANPQQLVTKMPVLSKDEERQILTAWSSPQTCLPESKCIHQLFEVQVEKTPDAVAVVYEDQQLTYGQLNRKANQLAHHLLKMGVVPDTRVAISVERGLDMVVGLLAILKAGGAYVPLDPSYPMERLMYMLEDSAPRVLLTQSRLRDSWGTLSDQVPVFELDRDTARWDRYPSANLDPTDLGLSSDHLAYVIYTSGSTGTPKGVMVEHRNIYCSNYARRLIYGNYGRFLLISPISFDSSVAGIFGTLTNGGTLVVVGQDVIRDPYQLYQNIENQQIDSLLCVPSLYGQILDLPGSGIKETTLSKVIVAGEACPVGLLVKSAQCFPQTSIYNEYGPTESTVWATVQNCTNLPATTQKVPIGNPVAHVRVYILDSHRQPVPVGVAGEIYIGGAGVARGYLNRPELTTEKFLPDPFARAVAGEPHPRMYKTGDLGRWLPDGNIEFLGRNDFQVKIRGFRIELGEIEAVLTEHHAVKEAVVILREDHPGHKRLIAYLIPEKGTSPDVKALRSLMQARLPDFMLPSAFLTLDVFPLNLNGKLDRRALPVPDDFRQQVEAEYEEPRTETERIIASIWKDILHTKQVGIHDNFFELGGDSLLVTQVHIKLVETFQQDISLVELFQYPTVYALARRIHAGQQENRASEPVSGRVRTRIAQRVSRQQREQQGQHRERNTDIAIIGMSCRFPGADTLDTFWRNLCNGLESITFFSDQELLSAGVDPALLTNPNYVKAGAILDNIDRFDASFFDYNPREAGLMDPQHRLFLEEAWKTLESAGYNTKTYKGAIGVYAGAGMGGYLLKNLYPALTMSDPAAAYQIMLGNQADFMATRVSYKLNLRGPGLTVQTACSTSLVAIHLACQAILHGECDMALAGGVTIHIPQQAGYIYQEGMILSPDGHCRAFDARAQGIVPGSGVGIVLLKRMEEAVADGDYIYAVIKGTAMNNDGSLKMGYAAPGIDGQKGVIAEAQAVAGIDADTITYIEAHGTGTELGDPIEMTALTQVFRENTLRKGFCAVGSVKTNFGHLDAAAGVAGIMKTALALKHQMLPPSLHFHTPNPKIDIENTPFYVNATLSQWDTTNGNPRRAGVSSFGIGGTNAHVVLEDAPPRESSTPPESGQLFVISARTETALAAATTHLAEHLQQHPDINLADAAYTLQIGRRAFSHKRMAVCKDVQDAIHVFNTLHPQRVSDNVRETGERSIVFMFPGQGAQYVNMGQGVYRTEPYFRDQIDRCSELLIPLLAFDLRDVLYPESRDTGPHHLPELHQTAITQPAIFVIEYALAQFLRDLGIQPQAVIGHSIGEYAAACLAGVFSLEDALKMVVLRGQLMQSLPLGTMLSVSLPEQELQSLLPDELSLAAVNAPCQCVVSGPTDAVERFQSTLADNDTAYVRLHTSHAFHSAMVDPVLDAFNSQLKTISLYPPQIPWISTVTGNRITAGDATDPDYWTKNLRHTVRFSDGMRRILESPDPILVETGPGRTLSSLAKQHPERKDGLVALTALRHAKDDHSDRAFFLTTLGKLWLEGVSIDWDRYYAPKRRFRVPLPTYPFERQRYWTEPAQSVHNAHMDRMMPEKKRDITDWFYVPVWEQSALSEPDEPAHESELKSCWLLFIDQHRLGKHVIERLQRGGQEIITVKTGSEFAKIHDLSYTLDPQEAGDYHALLAALSASGKTPDVIVHVWNITPHARPHCEVMPETHNTGYYSLLFLARALGKQEVNNDIQVIVVSNHTHKVTQEDQVCPEKAMLLGPLTTIPQEYPHLRCRSLDVPFPTGRQAEETLADHILSEIRTDTHDTTIAFRGDLRWVKTFTPVQLKGNFPEIPSLLREYGVYLITGGLGHIGLVLAEYLAKTVRARLILTGRTFFPVQAEWDSWLCSHGQEDRISHAINTIRKCEAFGGQVLTLKADTANQHQIQDVIDKTENLFGRIHGVIHSADVSDASLFHPIAGTGRTESELIFQEKVYGTLALERVLQGKKLDFCILMSSLSSILGGLGHIAYSAANIFLDTCAHTHNQTWMSINWDAWSPEFQQTNRHHSSPGAALAELAILPEDGERLFQYVFSWGKGNQLIVSTGDLQARITQWIKLETVRKDTKRENLSLFQTQPRPSGSYAAPRDETEQRIVEIWQQFLGVHQIGIDDNFFDLGGDSLLAIQVLGRLRETFHTDLSPHHLLHAPTVATLAELMRQNTPERERASKPAAYSQPSLIVQIQAGHANRQPLFLIHPVGGHVYFYRELARHLGRDLPVYGIQAHGFEDETEPLSNIEDMAAAYIQELRVLQPDGPYFLGGASFGGGVAFEMAHQLHAHGETVAFLTMIDTPGADRLSHDILDDSSILQYITDTVEEARSIRIARNDTPTEEQLYHLMQQAQQMYLLPSHADATQLQTQLQRFIRVFKANMQAIQNYVPRMYPGRILFFRASELREKYDPSHPELSWIEMAAEGIEIHTVPGNHITMNFPPHVRVMAEKLRACLDRVAKQF